MHRHRALAGCLLLLSFVIPVTPAFARPTTPIHRAARTVDLDGRMDTNNIDMFVSDLGSFAYNADSVRPGLEFPRGSGRTAMYAAGLWIGARVNGGPRVTVSTDTQEYVPGPMIGNGPAPDQARYRNYKILRGDTLGVDYLNWPGDLGAPLDSLGDPALSGDAMIWSVYNDADPTAHFNPSGGTSPLGVEIHQSTFAFHGVGPQGNVVFLRFKLYNKGMNQLDSMYVSAWADPDLGGFTDDLIGCDTTRSMAYCYNGTDSDAIYGAAPPAIGLCLIQGVPTATDTLCMTAFSKYVNGTDPMDYSETYHTMEGLTNDGSPIHELNNISLPITTCPYSGDPLLGTGWVDSAPGDRRFLISTGPFAMAPGDSQQVVYAICIGQGTDRLSSVTALRSLVDQIGGGCRNSPEIPTAVSATLLDAMAEKDRVRLTWAVSDPGGVSAEVFRRDARTDWMDLGPAESDGLGRIVYEDRTVQAGKRYGYRLVLRERSGETTALESWVEVPGEATPSIAMLRVAGENPSGGNLRVSYALPSGGPVRLEVFDVQGRRVAVLANAFASSGWHEIEWNGRADRGAAVASGLYLMRLSSRYGVLLRKAIIAR